MIYQALADLEAKNKAGAFCIIVRSAGSTPRHAASKMLVYRDGTIIGSVGGGELENRVIAEALKSISDGKPRLLEYAMSDPQHGDPGVCGGQVEIFVEPVLPKPTIVVAGTGHVGKAVVQLAHWAGFRVAATDDRPDFCTPEAAPGADDYYPVPLEMLGEQMEIGPWTYLILTTRGMNVDVAGLPALLDTQAGYIGIIGSRRRWSETRKALVAAGVSQEKISRVHSPIGLELNAETPEEIAISILAEIIMLRNGGDGSMMAKK